MSLIFETENVRPFMVRKLKWGGEGGVWSPGPYSGYAPDIDHKMFCNDGRKYRN